MIEIVATEESVSCKVKGSLTTLMQDAEHIAASLASALVNCAPEEFKARTLMYIQHSFSNALLFAYEKEIESDDDSDTDTDSDLCEDHDQDANGMHIQSIKIDLNALHELMNDHHDDKDDKEHNNE